MSSGFTFGASAGFPGFGAANTQTTTQPTSLFGNALATSNAQPAFGTALAASNAQPAFGTALAASNAQPAKTTGFNFGGTSAPLTFGGGNMNFGATNLAVTTASATASGSLGFGGGVLNFNTAPATGTAAAGAVPGGLGFGLTPAKTAGLGGISLGGGIANATQPAVANAATVTATATPFGGGFGTGLGGGLTGGGLALATGQTTTAAGQFSFGGLGGGLTAQTGLAVTTAANTSFGGLKLGNLAAAAMAAPTTTATTSLLGGLLSGTKPTSTTAASSAPAGSTGFSFGANAAATGAMTSMSAGIGLGGQSTLLATATPGLTSSAAPAAPSAGFTLSSTPVSSAASAALTSGLSLNFGATSAAASAPVATAATTTSCAAAPVAVTSTASSMNYRQLEDAINKWTQELEEQETVFLDQATQVNAWDRLLIENGDMIVQLNHDVEKVKADQQRLDQELDFIIGQQCELEDLLKPLEQALEQLPPITYQQHADLEREHTYKLAENIDSQLKRMASDLKEIVEHLNSGSNAQDNNDPLIQIAKILNAHVDSLQWIDQKTGVLQRRVEEVARQSTSQRKQQTYR